MRTRISIFSLLLLSCAQAPADPPRPAAAAIHAAGTIDLVESAPIETSLDHPDIADAYEVWPAMIASAERSLDVAEFYVSDAPRSRLSTVIAAIEAAADRGVKVRFLADALFGAKYPATLDRLAARPNITLRRFDVGKVMGGVLHAKYFVVDGRDVFLGSQNFDWRSLTHVQEMGVRIRDEAAAASYEEVFAMDWALAAGEEPPPPRRTPLRFDEQALGEAISITPVFSPRGFLPHPKSWELPRMIAMIDEAKRSIHVQVLTYKTHSRDGSPFPDLDDALRRAAARGVSVRLAVADWSKRRGSVEAVKKLARVPGVSVRFLDIPPWSGGFVAFARVAHAKYMVVDGARAWVGSSNWEGDYFTRSRNVGVIVESPAIAGQLERVFRDGFSGPYAEVVNPDGHYDAPKVDGD